MVSGEMLACSGRSLWSGGSISCLNSGPVFLEFQVRQRPSSRFFGRAGLVPLGFGGALGSNSQGLVALSELLGR